MSPHVHAHPSVVVDEVDPGVVDVVDAGVEDGSPCQEGVGLGDCKQTSQRHRAKSQVLSASMLGFLSCLSSIC